MKTLIILLLSFYSITFSQELNCKVTVNFENLPVVNRELLTGFGAMIEDYMNKTKFTNLTWEGEKIQTTMNIFFTNASSEINYTAQVFIGSQRPIYKSYKNSSMLNILDEQWSFQYERGQALYSNQSTFEPISSFLDYYANIIIGYDLDSWEELGGSPYFAKAYDIVNLGAASSFSPGWQLKGGSFSYNRRGLVEDLTNEKFRPFREAFYDYHYGIDIYEQSKEKGQEEIVSFIETLDEMKTRISLNSVLINVFFNAKHGEIVDRLKDYPDKTIFRTLAKIDPSHASKYDEVMN